MKALILAVAIAAGFAMQPEGCLSEKLAWQDAPVVQQDLG